MTDGGNGRGDDTWGIEVLTAANYQSFEEVVDKTAAKRGVDRTELREALATWVDHDLDIAATEHEVPTQVITEAAANCRAAAEKQYPDQI
ncbi:hypothetical protein PN419_00145 [Halorubrum ezzemoulense]|nr:hypothetical protein [Halorubrum ezzemoulense]MDB9247417.1 hypothetical protein [Halorubrum ezzemoulense]MDB9258674.1 hypothetical protein [Halorubrum ezzemoulense]MDB9264468.1 hypothetical protein [Halorubrum ezzemoulense]MDB9269035.1 hypothetical protein [Halorubrum ezzemoulense]MDB9271436.1 hypothetical protein [Halorubrum ezzemoulense]